MKKMYDLNNISRKEKVYLKLKELSLNISKEDVERTGKIGIETKYISEILNINRSNVSKELNNLFKEKKVVKVLGKPILYIDKKYLEKLLNIEFIN